MSPPPNRLTGSPALLWRVSPDEAIMNQSIQGEHRYRPPVGRFHLAGLPKDKKASMSLSDEERRRLRELEEELAAEDPDLARQLQDNGPSDRSGARIVYGLLIIVAGFALVITGISTQLIVLGVIGFLAAGAGAYLFLSGRSRRRSPG